MNKAFVTLLIRSFRGGQATIAHYFYAISYYIIAVTGGVDLHHSEYVEGNVMTEYEERFTAKGNPICRLVAHRDPQKKG